MYNWKLQNSNATQTAWQPAITFSDSVFWNHMRAGTVIVIYHRCCKYGTCVKGDGYTQLAANETDIYSVFSGGNFGNPPGNNGPTLNVDPSGGLLVLLDASGNVVHALGHRSVPGPLFNSLPLPKLNHDGNLNTGEALFVCPGSNPDENGTLAPQEGSTWTTAGPSSSTTPGLPSVCAASATGSSDFRRSLRQPQWINPTLSGSANGAGNLVTLNWNAQEDAYPPDQTEGYLILRNTSDNFGTPADGRDYYPGENIGGAVVDTNIRASQTLTYIDTVSVPCTTGLYYRIFPFRYCTDYVQGNTYDPARGRAYNETSFTTAHVTAVLPVAPVAASSDRDNICSSDTGHITLSAAGGSGATLNWYTTGCGGTLIGSVSGPANSLAIPSPANTTTYYAGWENSCGMSACASLTVTVIPAVPVSLTLTACQSNVCQGTPVTFTAHPVNEGNSPVYNWTVNGNALQTGSSPVYINNMTVGDTVSCWLTSSVSCTVMNPVESPPLALTVYPLPVVDLTDEPFLCAGDPVQLDAGPGFTSYLWQDGSPGQYYTATNTGNYMVTVTDSFGCIGSDSVQVKNCDSALFVPDAFTPNNDGLNDVFRAVSSGDNITRFSMQIYDRWGALVFESNDIIQGWNGQIKNKLAPADTYVWVITYQPFSISNAHASTTRERGTVVLIR